MIALSISIELAFLVFFEESLPTFFYTRKANGLVWINVVSEPEITSRFGHWYCYCYDARVTRVEATRLLM